MTKIPVAGTVAEAYRFTFIHLGKIIGLIWLPVVVLTVGGYFVQTSYLSAMAVPIEGGDISRQGPAIAGLVAYSFVAMLLVAVIAVAITREILAPLKRPVFLRFGLGGAELRVFGGYIGLIALACVFVFGLILVSVVIGLVAKSAMGAASAQAAAGIGVLIGLVGTGALIFVFARLSFLLVPAAVMDGKFGLERSWELTKGNFWRIVVIAVATVVPIVLVSLALDVVVLGPDFLNPHLELAQDAAARARHAAEQMRQISEHLPVLMGVRFLMAPFSYGLLLSPAVFAYRALTGGAKT